MQPWQWWSWFFLIFQLTQAEEVPTEVLSKETNGNPIEEKIQHREELDLLDENLLPAVFNDDETGQLASFDKRNPFLSRWGGQRLSDFFSYKRRPAFSSWGGKRGPAFSSWGGKRSVPHSNDENSNNSHDSTFIKKYPFLSNEEHSETPSHYAYVVQKFLNDKAGKNGHLNKASMFSYSGDHNPTVLHKSQEQTASSPGFIHPTTWSDNNYKHISNEHNKDSEVENYCLDDYNDDDDENNIKATVNLENGQLILSNLFDKKSSPSFNSWGGKRAPAFNSWGGKREPAFNSWGGKRVPAFNSWGGKRAQAFNSWGGKRVPAFNSWGGKRVPAFNSWGGKRAPAFNSWGGKRSAEINDQKEYDSTNKEYQESYEETLKPFTESHRSKRSLSPTDQENNNKEPTNTWEEHDENVDEPENYEMQNKRAPALNFWGEKLIPPINRWDRKRAPAFNSWGGKRAPAFNSWGGKRVPAFNSWGGKRAPAFNSWGGKRAPAFNSWGGKRVPAFNSWGGKRAPAFNSWGGKRAPAFNSWGGKRVPAFNSWGGKRAPAFNSWGGKRVPAFNSWGGKRAPAFNSWGGKRSLESNDDDPNNEWPYVIDIASGAEASDKWEDKEQIKNRNYEDIKRAATINVGRGGKRLPAFHSWGGKRSFNNLQNSDDDFSKSNFFQNKLLNMSVNKDNENEPVILRNHQELSDGGTSQEENSDPNEDDYETHSLNDYADLNSNHDSDNFHQLVKRSLKTEEDYKGKRNPAFFSWGGKRNVPSYTSFSEEKPEEPDYKLVTSRTSGTARIKRSIKNHNENSISFVTSNNENDDLGNEIQSEPEEMYSVVPSGMTICCIKRAKYGDRNLFMQMLLRTKSFRDLSWPTIRPIRRGADFYPWGGKRSLL